MSITMRSALYLSLHDLAEAQTIAYGSGWTSSPIKLMDICRVQSIDFGRSLVLFDGHAAIGIALVGTRADRGWLHDIAVAPAYRRAGMGRRLMQTVLQQMQASGIREIELDVSAARADAIGLYTRLGFKRRRVYLNLAAKYAELELDRIELAPGHQIVAGTETQLIAAYASAHPAEPEPCWDRSLASLLLYPDGFISRLLDGERELGLMHYLARPAEAGDPDRIRPLFVRLAPGSGAEVLAELLAGTGQAAFGDAGRLTVRVALEPKDSALAAMLQELRVPVVAESYDMRLALTS